jgi:uncharacterized membrane protein (UPF0182 family)
VPVGSLFNKLLYAAKFQEGNILLSNFVNSESKILYDRDPRERVEKVAPYLTVDGDPLPAVVDGRVVWIIDGYTTLDDYPYAQRVSLDAATEDTRVRRQNVVGQPQRTVNYVRNSVKAVVDAYDGSVDLYEWDADDPVLKAWKAVFPDSLQPRSAISPDLLSHLRYPQDLFKVQRELLTKYHVTDAGVFYGGQERWVVPDDPSGGTTAQVAQPPYYLTLKAPEAEQAAFSLTTAFTRPNPPNLSSFMSVNAEASSPDYGTIDVLELPSERRTIQGPGQVANTFETDQNIAEATLALRRGDAQTAEGNLLTLPVGGGFLYVQPIYVERSAGAGRYPLLRLVFVSFGDRVAVGNTLQEALDKAFQGDSGTTTGETGTATPPRPGATPSPGARPSPGTPAVPQDLQAAIRDAQAAFDAAQTAQRAGDWAAYGQALDRLETALNRIQQLDPASASPSPNP